MPNCEMPRHKKEPQPTKAVGLYQVYDDRVADKPMATMTRPAHLCQGCLDFAKSCGMRPEKVS
jgi:hypothetical protein